MLRCNMLLWEYQGKCNAKGVKVFQQFLTVNPNLFFSAAWGLFRALTLTQHESMYLTLCALLNLTFPAGQADAQCSGHCGGPMCNCTSP